jgi:hypothetical protein
MMLSRFEVWLCAFCVNRHLAVLCGDGFNQIERVRESPSVRWSDNHYKAVGEVESVAVRNLNPAPGIREGCSHSSNRADDGNRTRVLSLGLRHDPPHVATVSLTPPCWEIPEGRESQKQNGPKIRPSNLDSLSLRWRCLISA